MMIPSIRLGIHLLSIYGLFTTSLRCSGMLERSCGISYVIIPYFSNI